MKIICVGRNYTKHAKELGNEVPDEPVIFLKPDTALLKNNDPFYLPNFSNSIHYEVELLVKISKAGKNIDAKFAPKYYEQIGLGIDFTARDIQSNCKEKGLPWERAKAFDHSAVVSNFVSKENFKLEALRFSLEKNGKQVQLGNTQDMLFSIDKLIENVSKFLTLKQGDIIFTGTPEGVGPISLGDRLEGKIEEQTFFNFEIK